MEEIKNNISRLSDEQAEQVSGGINTPISFPFPNELTVNTSGARTQLHTEPSINSPYVPNSILYDGDKVAPTSQEQNNMKYVIIQKNHVGGWISKTLLRQSPGRFSLLLIEYFQ